MQRAKVRKNYQVTLPKNFLEKVEKKFNLRIQVGDEIDFDVTQDKKIAVKIIRKKEEQIYQ